MRIIAISDTHGYRPNLPEGDLLIHSGNATMLGSYTEVLSFIQWMLILPHKYKIFTPGNHDFRLDKLKITGVNVLVNEAITIEGIKIWASPYTPIFGNWAFMKSEKGLAKIWSTIPENTDIVVTHGPPKNILDLIIEGDRTGSATLRAVIKDIKPKYHIFGHIHESYGHLEEDNIHYVNASVVNRNYELVNLPIVIDI